MTAMPACWAPAGPCRVTGWPSISSSPESGWYTPARIFTMVDLPAPFSPTSACASPANSSIVPSMTARTAPNDLVAWRSARTGPGGAPSGAAWGPGGRPASRSSRPAVTAWSFLEVGGGLRGQICYNVSSNVQKCRAK